MSPAYRTGEADPAARAAVIGPGPPAGGPGGGVLFHPWARAVEMGYTRGAERNGTGSRWRPHAALAWYWGIRMPHTVLRFAWLLGLLAGVSACAPPPPPPPTIVNLTLKATADINPTETGSAAPVQLRVYQLTSTAAFAGAEFFALLERDAATLGDQLVRREDFLLAPDETRTSTLNPEARVTALGIFVGVRSLDGVTWRGTWAVPPNKTSAVTVTAARTGVTVGPTP